jgi:hypothetical protein
VSLLLTHSLSLLFFSQLDMQARWIGLDSSIKAQIKTHLLHSLGSIKVSHKSLPSPFLISFHVPLIFILLSLVCFRWLSGLLLLLLLLLHTDLSEHENFRRLEERQHK